jgi:DNA-directed RNA polymerase alpha subunit
MADKIKLTDLKLSRPSHNALAHAGITTLTKLSKYSEKEILALHGVGPASMPELKAALKKCGLSFTKK